MHGLRSDRKPAPQERLLPIKKVAAQVQSVTPDPSPSTSRANNVLHLQQTIGNQAVQRLMAQNRLAENTVYPRSIASRRGLVARQCACSAELGSTPTLQREDDPDDESGSIIDQVTNIFSDNNTDVAGDSNPENDVGDNNSENAGAGDPLAQNDNALLDIANITDISQLSDLSIPGISTPCKPAFNATTAKAMHFAVRQSWLKFSSAAFGAETTSVWDNYLDSTLGLPRPTRTFAGSGEIVSGFSQHHKSVESEKEIVTTAGKALSGSKLLPAPGAVTSIPLTSAVPAATLRKRINDKTDPMGLNYDSPATQIAGNLAGGIGDGGSPGNTVAHDADTRDVIGSLQLSLDNAGTNLTITPQLTFNVHDTVDFCPGNLGNIIARAETVPMSILEATEALFGTVFAADVPLNVAYPGAGTPQTVAVSKSTP